MNFKIIPKTAVGNALNNPYTKFEPNRPTRNVHYGRPQVPVVKFFQVHKSFPSKNRLKI